MRSSDSSGTGAGASRRRASLEDRSEVGLAAAHHRGVDEPSNRPRVPDQQRHHHRGTATSPGSCAWSSGVTHGNSADQIHQQRRRASRISLRWVCGHGGTPGPRGAGRRVPTPGRSPGWVEHRCRRAAGTGLWVTPAASGVALAPSPLGRDFSSRCRASDRDEYGPEPLPPARGGQPIPGYSRMVCMTVRGHRLHQAVPWSALVLRRGIPVFPESRGSGPRPSRRPVHADGDWCIRESRWRQ